MMTWGVNDDFPVSYGQKKVSCCRVFEARCERSLVKCAEMFFGERHEKCTSVLTYPGVIHRPLSLSQGCQMYVVRVTATQDNQKSPCVCVCTCVVNVKIPLSLTNLVTESYGGHCGGHGAFLSPRLPSLRHVLDVSKAE